MLLILRLDIMYSIIFTITGVTLTKIFVQKYMYVCMETVTKKDIMKTSALIGLLGTVFVYVVRLANFYT